MDRVRLGRVLGRGARMAARTVYEAVDAATTPSPTQEASPAARRPQQAVGAASFPPSTGVRRPASGTVQQAVRTAGRLQSSAGQARRGVLAPVKRASKALSLEMSGSFFALFAASFGIAVWRTRSALHTGMASRVWLYAGLAGLFTYFAVSSFLRARRIQRG